MTNISEVDALKVIDDTLTKVEDKDARNRILEWAYKKFGSSLEMPTQSKEEVQKKSSTKTKKTKETGKKHGKNKSPTTLSIVKDLNLKPNGKESFNDFADKKKPTSNQEKCVVAVYYLKKELVLPNISINHIYTCFKDAKWRVPADLVNTLQYIASQRGWLDTSNSTDIKLTTLGENLVEHDLPPKKKEK